MLFLVLIIGRKIGGSCRWIDLGFMNFQVSELTKLSTIIFLATRLNQKPTLEDGYKISDLITEIFLNDENLESMIAKKKEKLELLYYLKKKGFKTMFYDGIIKALKGVTTLEEVYNVVKL